MSKLPVRAFVDTEFSDFKNPSLISIGMVAAETEDSLYIVLDSCDPSAFSYFVLETVLPLLDLHEPEVLSRDQAARRILEFLDRLRDDNRDIPILLTSDSEVDIRLISALIGEEEGITLAVRNITGCIAQNEIPAQEVDLFFIHQESFFQGEYEAERHHALVDAKSLKYAWKRIWKGLA